MNNFYRPKSIKEIKSIITDIKKKKETVSVGVTGEFN